MNILRHSVAGLVALALWLVSVGLAIGQIIIVRELIMSVYAFYLNLSGAVLDIHGTEFWAGVTLRNFIVLFLAIGVVIFAVATGEYHARHVGTRQSWKIFAWTFVVQFTILVLGYFI